MLIVDTLRGQHSTGVAVVGSTGDTRIAKAVGHAYDLFDSRQYNGVFNGVNRVLIGHNRYATTGSVNKRNAHPFDFDSLVGAHNGTLNTKWKLFENNKFQVDSEALYHHIEQKGLKDALDNLAGAWALTWWDKQKKTINFLRNKERTLYITTDDKAECIYWASEYWMLSGLLHRNNISHDKIELLTEDKHFEFPIDMGTGVISKPHMYNAPATYVAPIYNQHTATKHGYSDPPKPLKNKKESLHPNVEKITGTVGLVETDRNGGKYLSIYAEGHEDKDVRWYYDGQTINPMSFCGEEVTAEMYLFRICDSKGLWYRVNPVSVHITYTDPVVESKEEEGSVGDEKGEFVCNCMWCQTPIFKGDMYGVAKESFFSGEDKLCGDCATDPEIKDYITVVSTGHI